MQKIEPNTQKKAITARHHGARCRAPLELVGQREYALVQPGAVEFLGCAALEVATNGGNAHVEALGKNPGRELGAARALVGIFAMPHEIAVELERYGGERGDGSLKRGVAACVMLCVLIF